MTVLGKACRRLLNRPGVSGFVVACKGHIAHLRHSVMRNLPMPSAREGLVIVSACRPIFSRGVADSREVNLRLLVTNDAVGSSVLSARQTASG